MDFPEVVRRRRMVRAYLEDELPADQVRRIVQTARRAPSAGFTQGQSFVVVTDREVRERIGQLSRQGSYTERGFHPWISKAPLHVIVCTSARAYGTRYGEPDKQGTSGAKGEWECPWWYWDAAASFMLLLLAAVNEGLGAGFLAFKRDAQQPVRELLSIPPEVEPIGVVTIGKPADDRRSSSLRRGWKPEDQVIHYERWGG